MRVSRLSLPVVIVVALSTSSGRAQDERSRVWIEPKDVPAVEQAALLGDAQAASRLARYALVFGESADRGFWTNVAAENGDATAQFNRGSDMLCHVSPRDRVRAEFWLQRASQAGHAGAATALAGVRNGENPCGYPRSQ